jgi:hypothetical protein
MQSIAARYAVVGDPLRAASLILVEKLLPSFFFSPQLALL